MKKKITSLLKESIDTLQAKEIFLGDIKIDIHVTESKNLEHGDYGTVSWNPLYVKIVD